MIERSEEEDDVRERVGDRKRAGIPDLERREAAPAPMPCLLDQPLRRIEEMDLVAPVRERERVRSGAAPDVEHPRRRRGRVAPNQLHRPDALELERTPFEACLFRAPGVIFPDFGIERRALRIASHGGSIIDQTRIGGAALRVADLERSLDYYRNVLGFVPLEGETHPRVARLGAAGSARPLLELHEHPGARPVPRRGRIGLYHVAILLPSRGDLGRFLDHVMNRDERLGASDHGVSEALYLTDPDGITIEIYRDRPRSEWPVQGGHVWMGNEPLDGDAVLRSGGGAPFEGLPEGTTVGHVHFYVEDLEKARAFYVDALGFDVTFEGYPGALFVASGGYHHHVGLNTWAAGSPIAGPEDAGIVHWELILPDARSVEAAAARARAAGHDVAAGAAAVEARDPWGIAVHLLDGQAAHPGQASSRGGAA
jgi:catechol 2,3-dioxygenase